eukprot:6188584-Pleurochrysis_carterae.AAC.3
MVTLIDWCLRCVAQLRKSKARLIAQSTKECASACDSLALSGAVGPVRSKAELCGSRSSCVEQLRCNEGHAVSRVR